MSTIKLPCFYHPTTTVIIDDDETFIENLVPNLKNNTSYKLFDHPAAALNFLQACQDSVPTPQDFIGIPSQLADDTSQQFESVVNVDVSKIHNKLYDQTRFTIPSVVIVDHDMPGMSGIEFCRRLSAYPIKKVMLTGVADHKLAIQAFNDGIIHQFILKDEPHIFESIDKAVFSMQQNYFTALSGLTVKNIVASTFSYLENKAFTDFFYEFLKKNAIAEFYLVDPIGSFLLLDTDGNLIWFVVQSDQKILNYYQIAEDREASNDIMQSLAKREKLVCLFSEEDYKQPVENWHSYLFPANKIEALHECYYSIIRGDHVYKSTRIHKNKIVPYNTYFTTAKLSENA